MVFRDGSPFIPLTGKRNIKKTAGSILFNPLFDFILILSNVLRPGPVRPDSFVFIRYRCLVRILRNGRQSMLMNFELFQYHLNGLVELIVIALIFTCRVIVYEDIRLHTPPLYDPLLSVNTVRGEFGFKKLTAVQKWQGSSH